MKLGRTRRRSLRLAGISLLSLVALSALPANRVWLVDVAKSYAAVPRQLRHLDPQERLRTRHYRNYAVIEYIARSLRAGDTLLLPPPDYVRRHYDSVYWNWSEPKYVYYMLGRQPTVTIDSPQAARATCTVVIDDRGRPSWVRITNSADLERIRATFRE
jgi:hypothetical protein